MKVTVFRRASRGNPLSTLIAKYFGMPTADIAATATAEASPANAMTCVKPFTIPDRWIEEHQTPPWDPDDTFDVYDKWGNPLADPDRYYPATDKATYTGYNATRDKGMEVAVEGGQRRSRSRRASITPGRIPGNSGGIRLPSATSPAATR